MTGDGPVGDGSDGVAPKRATLRTRHDDPVVLARAVRPDNTDAMRTTVGDSGGRAPSDGPNDGRVVTRIARPTTGGLRSTVDDYVVNLRVAETVAAIARGVDRAERTGASHEQNDSDITTHDTHDT